MENDDPNARFDRAHRDKYGEKPEHAEATARLPDIGAHKIEVDRNANIIRDEIYSGKHYIDTDRQEQQRQEHERREREQREQQNG
jgi:hypothetical protein